MASLLNWAQLRASVSFPPSLFLSIGWKQKALQGRRRHKMGAPWVPESLSGPLSGLYLTYVHSLLQATEIVESNCYS